MATVAEEVQGIPDDRVIEDYAVPRPLAFALFADLLLFCPHED